MTRPCYCRTEEEALRCRRARTKMIRPLWQLCQRSEAHRELWDSLQFRLAWIRSVVQRIQSLPWKRYTRFTQAVLRYILAGLPRATAADVAFRRGKCDPCIWRDRKTDSCNQCGCHLGGKKELLSKLSWATEKCPLYDPVKRPGQYWGPVKGETIWRRGWNKLVSFFLGRGV